MNLEGLEKIVASFRVKANEKSEGIVLPQAFIAKTKEQIGMVPDGVDVIVERNVAGNFTITWYNHRDQPVYQDCMPKSVDFSEIWLKARESLLSQISDEDMLAEIQRRKIAKAKAESEGNENANS